MTITLITGGARSGKSRHAENLVLNFPGRPIYIATAEIHDAEMAERIARHRARRGDAWIEHEAPYELADALIRTNGEGPRLVDCLTLWLSNLMLAERDWQAASDELIGVLKRQKSPVVLVSNEVGLGIVPDNRLARAFRDVQGLLNQRVAETADRVDFVVSGIPIKVKSE